MRGHPVALLGFRAFERSALASYFRLAANREPAYEQVLALAEARFIVADADQPEAVAEVRAAGRLADTLFIGHQAPDGATGWMPRPIDPLKVLRALDARLARPAAAPAAAPPGSGFVAVPATPPAPAAPPPARSGGLALLVDDSEIALRHLEIRLQALGLRTERAGTSGKALERLSHTGYDFVFIDVDLGEASELDGLSLCQHLKRQHHHAGSGRPPLLAIVSAFHAEVDRARGALAGADAYFAKPVDEAQLAAWLRQQGLR